MRPRRCHSRKPKNNGKKVKNLEVILRHFGVSWWADRVTAQGSVVANRWSDHFKRTIIAPILRTQPRGDVSEKLEELSLTPCRRNRFSYWKVCRCLRNRIRNWGRFNCFEYARCSVIVIVMVVAWVAHLCRY